MDTFYINLLVGAVVSFGICLTIFLNTRSNSAAETGFLVGWLVSLAASLIIVGLGFNNRHTINTEKRPAIVMKTFDNIVLKAKDWPEFVTKDFNVLDKPVEIIKTTTVNAYGMDEKVVYDFNIIPIEE